MDEISSVYADDTQFTFQPLAVPSEAVKILSQLLETEVLDGEEQVATQSTMTEWQCVLYLLDLGSIMFSFLVQVIQTSFSSLFRQFFLVHQLHPFLGGGLAYDY